MHTDLLELGLRPLDGDVDAVMAALDSDGSGLIDYMELYTALIEHGSLTYIHAQSANERAPRPEVVKRLYLGVADM